MLFAGHMVEELVEVERCRVATLAENGSEELDLRVLLALQMLM